MKENKEEKYLLTPFSQKSSPQSLDVVVTQTDHDLKLTFPNISSFLKTPLSPFCLSFSTSLPCPLSPKRRDKLWLGNCFECFIHYSDGSYDEWNFSPLGYWQSYHFTSYRLPHPPKQGPLLPFKFSVLSSRDFYIHLPFQEQKNFIGLTPSVIIEGKLFYAPQHPKEAPDFHRQKIMIPRQH